jgi:hypothetical protein
MPALSKWNLIQAVDRQMDGPGLMKFPWTHGPAAVDSVHGSWTRSTDRGPIPRDFEEQNNSVIKENSPALVILQKHT